VALDEKEGKTKRDEMICLASISGGASAYWGMQGLARFGHCRCQKKDHRFWIAINWVLPVISWYRQPWSGTDGAEVNLPDYRYCML